MKFQQERRYVVFKISDMLKYLDSATIKVILAAGSDMDVKRTLVDNKAPRRYVCVESDWPEYDRVWEMIEERAQADSDDMFTQATADLKAALQQLDKEYDNT